MQFCFSSILHSPENNEMIANEDAKKITTILFDCDNTLVLSETLAFEACADLTNEILALQNVPRRFTGPELQGEFVGQSFQDMVSNNQADGDHNAAG